MERKRIFAQNLKNIQEHHPKLYRSLAADLSHFDPEAFNSQRENESFEWTLSGEWPNLIYSRKSPQVGPLLYHQPDPVSEIAMVKAQFGLTQMTSAIICGLGLGYILKSLRAENRNNGLPICVIESNPQIFLHALSIQDFTEELNHSEIAWIVDRSLQTALADLQDFLMKFTAEEKNIRLLPNPASIHLAPDFYGEILKELPRIRAQTVRSYGGSVEDTMFGFSNTVDNLLDAFASEGLQGLKSQITSDTIISIASGPSLDMHWPILKEFAGKIPMIVCDSAVRKVMEEGIIPDYVTAVEREEIVTRYFSDLPTYEKTILIGPNLLLKSTLAAWKGKKALIRNIHAYETALGLDHLECIRPGHSAGNLNIVAATLLGFKNIFLVGHNLGYEVGTNRSHFKNIQGEHAVGGKRDEPQDVAAIERMAKAIRVERQDGLGEIWTDEVYDLFRIEMEQWIAQNSDRKYVNTAFQGAKIRGAEMLGLREAIEKYTTRFTTPDFNDLNLFQFGSTSISSRRRIALDRIQQTVDFLEGLTHEFSGFLTQLKKDFEKISDREKEGRFVSTDFLNQALDRCIQIKLKATENPTLFNAFISIIAPIHLRFERDLNGLAAVYRDDYLLKKDVLKAHLELYFPVWEKYLPLIREEFSRAKQIIEDANSKIPSSGITPSLSSVKPIEL